MSEERILVDISPLLDKNVDFARNTLFANSSEKFMFKCGIKEVLDRLEALPTIDPETLRPVAHWEEIPGSYEVCAGETGSWCVPATHCSNPECGEVNPCGLKTPFCPMCGFRMEDVPYDDD